jgi:hypothetical protein
MKKLLIPFIASFGLSLGIATGIVIVRTPKPPVVAKADKPAAPSAKSDSAGVAKAGATPAVTDSVSSASAAAIGQSASANVAGTSGAAVPGGAGVSAQSSAGHDTPVRDDATKSNGTAPPMHASNAKLASTTSAAPKTVIPAMKPATDSLIGRRLAQVFAAMQPKDAARVLEQMDDSDVRAILGSLSSKQQAAILGSFPTQRAALILQATLRTASSGGTE